MSLKRATWKFYCLAWNVADNYGNVAYVIFVVLLLKMTDFITYFGHRFECNGYGD